MKDSEENDPRWDILRSAITALYLYGGSYMNRGVRGAFFDIVEAADREMFNELTEEGPDWVYAKYFQVDD